MELIASGLATRRQELVVLEHVDQPSAGQDLPEHVADSRRGKLAAHRVVQADPDHRHVVQIEGDRQPGQLLDKRHGIGQRRAR